MFDKLEERFEIKSKAKAKLSIIGALFNKDKLEKELWSKSKVVDINVDKILEEHRKMVCIVKGIRYDKPEDK